MKEMTLKQKIIILVVPALFTALGLVVMTYAPGMGWLTGVITGSALTHLGIWEAKQ